MTLVAAYERLIGARGREITPAMRSRTGRAWRRRARPPHVAQSVPKSVQAAVASQDPASPPTSPRPPAAIAAVFEKAAIAPPSTREPEGGPLRWRPGPSSDQPLVRRFPATRCRRIRLEMDVHSDMSDEITSEPAGDHCKLSTEG